PVTGAGWADGDGTVCAVGGVTGPRNLSGATTAVSLFIGILLDQREPVFLHRIAILGGAVADAGAADPLEEGRSLSPLLGDEHRIGGSLGTRQAAEPRDKPPPDALAAGGGIGDDMAEHGDGRPVLAGVRGAWRHVAAQAARVPRHPRAGESPRQLRPEQQRTAT